jgi:hypothetical protein
MFAQVGDQIVVSGCRTGRRDRACKVLDVVNASGDSRYVVRWDDTGKLDTFSAGPDATIVSSEHRRH